MNKNNKLVGNPEEVAVRVSNVSKAFKLPHEKQSSIKGLFVSMFHGKRTYERQQVLNDISFEIKKGEFFGIVGRNGSGKSTLLKMLAGIYTPDKGQIQVNGKLTPFIELGVGFNSELTGRENVFLNGALLGFNREEMAAMYDEIVEFAELEKFMDQKLKNYSSGMQVRLAFSIAIQANTPILLLDEVLAVGDEAFQRKCDGYFKQLKKEKRTVILVTHSMDSIKKFCTRVMLIHYGDIKAIGDPDIVSEKYSKLNEPQATVATYEDKSNKIRTEYKDVHNMGDYMGVKISWHKSGVNAVGVALYKSSGERIFATHSMFDKFKITGKNCRYTIKLDVAPGEYFFRVRTYISDGKTSVGLVEQTPFFRVKADKVKIDGIAPLMHEWSNR